MLSTFHSGKRGSVPRLSFLFYFNGEKGKKARTRFFFLSADLPSLSFRGKRERKVGSDAREGPEEPFFRTGHQRGRGGGGGGGNVFRGSSS